MVRNFFGLEQQPFGVTADPRFFFFDPERRQAFDRIVADFPTPPHIAVVAGERGSGKTIFLRRVFEEREAIGARACFLSCGAGLTIDDIAQTAGFDWPPKARPDMPEAERPLILLLDDADGLPEGVLRQLFEALRAPAGGAGVSLILAGEWNNVSGAHLDRLLDESKVPVQRIPMGALCPRDVSEYIRHRLRAAGYQGPSLFEATGLQRIAIHSRGLPLLINCLCSAALVDARLEGKHLVSDSTVDRAATHLHPHFGPGSRAPDAPVEAKTTNNRTPPPFFAASGRTRPANSDGAAGTTSASGRARESDRRPPRLSSPGPRPTAFSAPSPTPPAGIAIRRPEDIATEFRPDGLLARLRGAFPRTRRVGIGLLALAAAGAVAFILVDDDRLAGIDPAPDERLASVEPAPAPPPDTAPPPREPAATELASRAPSSPLAPAEERAEPDDSAASPEAVDTADAVAPADSGEPDGSDAEILATAGLETPPLDADTAAADPEATDVGGVDDVDAVAATAGAAEMQGPPIAEARPTDDRGAGDEIATASAEMTASPPEETAAPSLAPDADAEFDEAVEPAPENTPSQIASLPAVPSLAGGAEPAPFAPGVPTPIAQQTRLAPPLSPFANRGLLTGSPAEPTAVAGAGGANGGRNGGPLETGVATRAATAVPPVASAASPFATAATTPPAGALDAPTPIAMQTRLGPPLRGVEMAAIGGRPAPILDERQPVLATPRLSKPPAVWTPPLSPLGQLEPRAPNPPPTSGGLRPIPAFVATTTPPAGAASATTAVPAPAALSGATPPPASFGATPFAATGVTPFAAAVSPPAPPSVTETPRAPIVSPAQSQAETSPTGELDALIAKGDSHRALGDVASARLFYQLAWNRGSTAAAIALGETFDPVYLERLNVTGTRPQPAKAAAWYRKGANGGDASATRHLGRLIDWLERAVQRGDDEAREVLESLR